MTFKVPPEFNYRDFNGFIKQTLFNKYSGQSFIVGSKFSLVREFLTVHGGSIRITDLIYTTVMRDDVMHYIVRVKVDCYGTIFSGVGVHRDFKKAHDMSCHNLIESMVDRSPGVLMPRVLTALPNWRGHCFFNSAFLPLLHSQVFVHSLFPSFLRAYDAVGNKHAVNPRKRQNLMDRVEPPNLWVIVIYNFLRDVIKASIRDDFVIKNVPPHLEKKLFPHEKVIPPSKSKPYNDLDLDDHQMLMLRHLSDYCSRGYETPGGFEGVTYYDLIRKLANNSLVFRNKFMFSVKGIFICRHCANFRYKFKYDFPVLELPGDNCAELKAIRLSEVLCEPFYWRQSIQVTCPNIVDGVTCVSGYRTLEDVELVRIPDFLAISLRGPLMEDSNFVIIPEEYMSLSINDQDFIYNRFAFSSVYRTYQTKSGESFGDRFLQPHPSYESSGWHTCINIKTTNGYQEVNNGNYHEPVPDLMKRYTEGSLLFYQLAEYEWLPVGRPL